MPQRTFTEARRIIARADDPQQWLDEFDRKADEARERMRGLNQGQRAKLDDQLARLAKAAQTNRDALAAANEERVKRRITEAQFKAKAARLAQDQRVVVAKAEKVKARLAQLDDREANAPEHLDRIAQTTGLGKTDFSF